MTQNKKKSIDVRVIGERVILHYETQDLLGFRYGIVEGVVGDHAIIRPTPEGNGYEFIDTRGSVEIASGDFTLMCDL